MHLMSLELLSMRIMLFMPTFKTTLPQAEPERLKCLVVDIKLDKEIHP